MIERRRYLALPCDCAGSCSVLLVSEGWIEDDPRQFSLDLHEHVRAQGRWRDRLRVAWAVLRGGEPYTHGLVLYSKKAAELRDFLTDTVPATEDPR